MLLAIYPISSQFNVLDSTHSHWRTMLNCLAGELDLKRLLDFDPMIDCTVLFEFELLVYVCMIHNKYNSMIVNF